MITYIKGQITEIYDLYIVVEAYGIGYEIMVTANLAGGVVPIGTELKVYTYQYIREDAEDLYGFVNRDDLNIFKLLITVNGIGPKNAMSILSSISPDDLRIAILSDDVKTIQAAPGIGGKTAQKIIIELKDKLSINDVITKGDSVPDPVASTANSARDEAIEALIALGYSSSEALKAVKSVDTYENTSSDDILKSALKKLAFM